MPQAAFHMLEHRLCAADLDEQKCNRFREAEVVTTAAGETGPCMQVYSSCYVYPCFVEIHCAPRLVRRYMPSVLTFVAMSPGGRNHISIS